MSQLSPIEWTESTWNPVTGCDKVSPGCKFCYAERMARRLKAMGSPNYKNGFELAVHPEALELPLRWKKPQIIFVNSMSDLFHRDIPLGFIEQTFDVMQRAHWHTFQILTKRADHLAEIAPSLPWPPNVWMGISVETPEYIHRIHDLRKVPAAVRFLSVEPLLAPFPRIPLTGIDWVIVGGESGPGCRPMAAGWVRPIRDRCIAKRVPFFFKQWGGVHKKRFGRTLDGQTWNELPTPKRRRIRNNRVAHVAA